MRAFWWQALGLSLFALCGAMPVTAATLTVAGVFSDHMVLQRDVTVPIWGKAAPDERVTVTLDGKPVSVVAGKDGAWMAKLPPTPAGGPHEITVAGAQERMTFTDVLFGEVWLCAGQSNMQFGLPSADNAAEAIAGANYPQLRVSTRGTPWTMCSPETAKTYSAVAFFFGRELQKALKVPVGLLVYGFGGSPIETWISPATLAVDPLLKREIFDPWNKYVAEYPQKADAVKPPIAPDNYFRPGNLFTGQLQPIIPFAVKGAVWYQGESDAWGFPIAQRYYHALPAMIADWRKAWGQQDFYFLTVQLPDAPGTVTPQPLQPSPWQFVQEVEAKTLELPQTEMAVTIDLGENDIHPKRKEPVGQRLALAARGSIYGERTLEYSGPRFERMTREGKALRLHFTHLGGGLVAKDGPLKGFTVAGDDRIFFWAEAKIDGDTILVSSDKVDNPEAARYAFSESSPFNLYNAAGLPAPPFRTDDWSWDTPVKAPRSLEAAKVEQALVIDGTLNDPAWTKTKAAGDFTLPHSYRPSVYPTTVRFAADAQNLYVAVHCTEPNLAGLVTRGTANDDEKLWDDDAIDLFLDIRNDRKNYVRFLINANGFVLDGTGFNDSVDGIRYMNLGLINAWRGFDKAWQGPCTVKTGREEDAWTVEMAIPWASLGLTKAPGSLGVQVKRYHANPFEESELILSGRDLNTGAMMPTCRLYGVPTRFARLVLKNSLHLIPSFDPSLIKNT